MQHPFLYFSRADARAFKEKMKSDPAAAAKYAACVADADKCLNEEFVSWERANGNKVSQHADFGLLRHQTERFCNVLGTKYIIEGDERCAEKLKSLLLHYISFERWHSVNYKQRFPVPWHSDLVSTGMGLAAAKTYDLIFDYLTEDERKTIAGGILEKGVYSSFVDWLMPETRIHALDSMGHNWWAVCICEAAAAFLAVSDYVDEGEKQRILGLVDRALADYLTYPGNPLFNKFGNFDDRGMFYESVAYNDYGTGSLLRYLWCNERYFGKNEVIRAAIPDGLCDAVMTFCYPVCENGKTVYHFLDFGDSGVDKTITVLAEYAVRLGIASAALRQCASTYEAGLWSEIGGYSPRELTGSLQALPKSAVFSSGYAISRAGYEPDAALFAVKSGYCWNHSHNDSGTFVIFYRGEPLFIDGGTCCYDSPFYHDYYCQDRAHSVLLIGGEGRRDEELYRGTKFPGRITDSLEGSDFFFAQADCTGPMAHLCSRMFRSFLWLDNRMLVIFDEVYCHGDNTVEFTLHYNADMTAADGGYDFENEKASARFIMHYPLPAAHRMKTGHPDHAEGTDMPYLELSGGESKRAHLLISTVQLDPGETETAFEPLSGENCRGLKIIQNDVTRELWFNSLADGSIMHDNSNNILGGYETDAYMLMITRNAVQGTERVLTVCGSYLRREGRVFMSSFIKKTAETVTSV